MDTLGRHLLIELWGCRRGTDDCSTVRQSIVEAVEAAGATILHLHVHAFSPYGVTGVAVLAESHLSIHTWPEHGYVAADVFTCGDTARPIEAVEVLRTAFQAQSIEVKQLFRGVRPPQLGPKCEAGVCSPPNSPKCNPVGWYDEVAPQQLDSQPTPSQSFAPTFKTSH